MCLNAMGAALLRLSKDQDFPYFIGTSMIYTGWAWAMRGEAEQGIELCKKGIKRDSATSVDRNELLVSALFCPSG
jgi:hypothetical protein